MSIRIGDGTNVPPTPRGLRPSVWLRADRGITVATGVSSWADLSGNGNNFTQPTSGLQPTYTPNVTGGIPGVTFGAGTGFRLNGSYGGLGYGDCEVVVVSYMTAAQISASTTYSALFSAYTLGHQRSVFVAFGAGIGYLYNDTSAIGTTYASAGFRLDRYTVTGTTGTLRINNSTYSGVSANFGATTDYLGNDTTGSRPFLGSIMEVVSIVGRNMTAGEWSMLLAGINFRYGQSWT